MNKSQKLGRGLEALIGGNKMSSNAQEQQGQQIIEVDVGAIVPNPNQPRKRFEDDRLKELAESIKNYGVLQPVVVRQLANGRYELVAGERRWHAVKMSGLVTIPCIVKQFTDLESLEVAILENIQRRNLSPIDESMAYKKLIDMYHYTHEKLAEKLNKSRSYISNMLRLLELPQDIQALLSEHKISIGHAKSLINVPRAEEVAEMITRDNLTVRDTERLVRKLNSERSTVRSAQSLDDTVNDDIATIAKTLSGALKINVEIVQDRDKMTVKMHCRTMEDLDEIVKRIVSMDFTGL
ncbi:ParB/RepB/Spo0J family partition protein [Rickettsiales endosymbiont of Peranema trichophorum]|uniref:ParB/RepB/Spo0J family partition protein n=1 Tax=Rickettsiales endosymbiont of Peranema trichophorum TaxID=2486577 RepID=UPI001023C2D1|nr:ParB/RepB/Spo0J family partition protein [Rickettsiales endosymbiont of Peranema trichophorum]RZI47182.1 ParB/RepB/Spo0J family partition protein [Rickettsiales endosymbiont of Peranema trichophorum]